MHTVVGRVAARGGQPSAHTFQFVPGREFHLVAAVHFDVARVLHRVDLAECAPGVFPPAVPQGVGLLACLLRQDLHLNIDAALPVAGVVIARGVGVQESAAVQIDVLIVL